MSTRRSPETSLPALVGAVIVAAFVAFLAPREGYHLYIAMQASTLAIAVIGLVVVFGYTGLINIGQGAFLGLGAYAVALGTTDYGIGFVPSLLIGLVLAGICGLVLGLSSLRLGGHYLAMVTISFQLIVTLILTNWIDFTHGPDGVTGIGRPMGFEGQNAYLGLVLVVLVGAVWGMLALRQSGLGRAMMAVRDNELAASTCGVPVLRVKLIAFSLSAMLGALGGSFFAGAFRYISPDQFTLAESIVILTMALLGGARSPFGALIGTVLLVVLPETLRVLRQLYLIVYGGAVVAIMIFLPDGLWGFVQDRLRRRAKPIAEPVEPLPLLAEKSRPSEEVMLDVLGLSKHFGGLKALDEASFKVRRGTMHALIGPNGSGKSTFINVATGLYKPTAGRVIFGGVDITRISPHRRNWAGLARTYQNIRVFRGMSVLENVMVGAERQGNDVAGNAGKVYERALAALDFVDLRGDAHRMIGDLSYGHQRYVEIARALAGSPELLLLDEPAAGLNSSEKIEMGKLLLRLKGHGLTILIIDHDMNLVSRVADHITVLNFGRVIADGTARTVLSNPDVIAAYLGKPHAVEAA